MNSRPTVLGHFELVLKGKAVPYTLRRSSRARLVWLNVKYPNGLTVTVPHRYNTKYLSEFLAEKSSWILKHLAQVHPPQKPMAQKDTICYLGQPFKVAELRNLILNRRTAPAEQSDYSLNIQPMLLVNENKPPWVNEVFLWLKNEARRLIHLKVQQYSQVLGLKYNLVRIREQKTRWGSCSCKRNLNFNWRLIMAPESVLDYVILHELCHLKEMSHSRNFWNLLAKYCPDWHSHRQWLNDHGAELNAAI